MLASMRTYNLREREKRRNELEDIRYCRREAKPPTCHPYKRVTAVSLCTRVSASSGSHVFIAAHKMKLHTKEALKLLNTRLNLDRIASNAGVSHAPITITATRVQPTLDGIEACFGWRDQTLHLGLA